MAHGHGATGNDGMRPARSGGMGRLSWCCAEDMVVIVMGSAFSSLSSYEYYLLKAIMWGENKGQKRNKKKQI